MFKKAIQSFVAIAVLIFCLSGCQAKINGTFLGRDIHECYSEWGMVPDKDILVTNESPTAWVELKKPVNYLGDKYSVKITYPVISESDDANELPFYSNRIDRIIYCKDFSEMSDEVVAKESAKIFKALEKDYGTTRQQISLECITYDVNGTKSLTSGRDGYVNALKHEKILEEIQSEEYGNTKMTFRSKWNLPDELKKLDSQFIKTMEDSNGFKSTYVVDAYLEYLDGRYQFTITHTFEAMIKNGERVSLED